MSKDKNTTATEAEAVVTKANQTNAEVEVNETETSEALKVTDLDKQWQKRVDAIFESDATIEKLYVTSDEQIFADVTFAKPHAKKLEDKTIGVIIKN